jgi:hypothetical protein
MNPRLPNKTFVIKWFKALMLSPGVLFPAGYLLLYLSTNIYLNENYKKCLAQTFNQATGNKMQISIKSLNAGFVFDSFTLNNIELTSTLPVADDQNSSDCRITISSLKIAAPDLQKLLFSRTAQQLSAKNVCDKILEEERRIQ